LIICIIIFKDVDFLIASESTEKWIFQEPFLPPQTQYIIDVKINTETKRLEGEQEIHLFNRSSRSIRRLVIDWPFLQEELKITCEDNLVHRIEQSKNGLAQSQMLIELSQAIEEGKSVVLKIQFVIEGVSQLHLGNIVNLVDWYPRIWWGRNTADDYEVSIYAPKEYQIATSGVYDEIKNCYIAEKCRKFGVVFMKNLQVLKDACGDTEIYSYYDEESRECVDFTHQTAVEVIDFYRNWLGFYPHKILHIIPGGLDHPAGGYLVATSIVGIHGQKRMGDKPKSHWQFITAHEIGHEYWMEHVLEAPNTFWLMIGLGVYADRAFMLAKGYGDQHERDMIQRYIQGVREQLDTRMNRLPEELDDVSFDYNNVVNHGKGFAVISALALVMGKESFESAYKRCLNEFQGRTLGVADFQRVCEEESGEHLDWFFDQWVRTSNFLSYKFISREVSSENGKYKTTVKIQNAGTLKMPVPVTALFEDGSRQCLFTDRMLEECSLVFTSQSPLKEIKMDAKNELPLVIPPPDATIQQLKRKLKELDFDGEGEEALQIFNAVKKIETAGQEFPWCRLGMQLYDEKHDQEALQAFQTGSRFDPNDFLGFVWQGHMHDLLHQRDKAVACYRQALALNPTSWVRHDQWGMKIDRAWIEQRLETPFHRDR
jgi:hypothetical protein